MSSEVTYTEKDLRDLLASFKKCLSIYYYTVSKKEISKIKAAKVVNPNDEFLKLTRLISAHTTKIGIVFKTPVPLSAAYKQVKETSEVFLLLFSLIGQLDPTELSETFVDGILSELSDMFSIFIEFVSEIEKLDFNSEQSNLGDDTDERLKYVGMTWDHCKKLEGLFEAGKTEYLITKVKNSIDMINDSAAELNNWLEDPQNVDEDDPFGLNDFSDDEQVNEKNEDEAQQIDPELIEFIGKWVLRIEFIKQLFEFLNNSILRNNAKLSGKNVDDLYSVQYKIVELTDDLGCSVFVQPDLEDITRVGETITSRVDNLVEYMNKLKVDKESEKLKWLRAWQDKYKKSLK